MSLNAYNFRQYLSRPNIEPHLAAWVLCGFVVAFLAFWSAPYIVPESVALRLPQATAASLQSPPSAFVVYTGKNFIYRNKLYNFTQLAIELEKIPSTQRDTLLIATASNTNVQELLSILQRLQALRFQQVAFTVKP